MNSWPVAPGRKAFLKHTGVGWFVWFGLVWSMVLDLRLLVVGGFVVVVSVSVLLGYSPGLISC